MRNEGSSNSASSSSSQWVEIISEQVVFDTVWLPSGKQYSNLKVKNLLDKNNTLLVNRKANGFEFKIRLFAILANYNGVVWAW